MSPASNLQAASPPSIREPKAPALEAARDEPRPQGALTRQDIALAIATKSGNVSKREAKRLVDTVIDEMVKTLTRGENLKLHDFGSFIVRGKGERAGRNPRTGAKVPIEPRQVIIFKGVAKHEGRRQRRGLDKKARRYQSCGEERGAGRDKIVPREDNAANIVTPRFKTAESGGTSPRSARPADHGRSVPASYIDRHPKPPVPD